MAKKENVSYDEIDSFLKSELASKKRSIEVDESEGLSKSSYKKRRNAKVNGKDKEVEENKDNGKQVVEKKKLKDSKKFVEEEEDLYLTKSFKPLKVKKRLKKGFIKLFKALILFAIIGFVGYISYDKFSEIYNMTKSVNVYKSVLKGASNTVNGILDYIPDDNDFEIAIDVKNNYEEYKYFNDNQINYNFNLVGEGYEEFFGVNDKGVYTLKNGNDAYLKYAGSDNVFKVNERNSNYAEMFNGLFINKDRLKKIVSSDRDILISVLKDEDIKSKNEELYINDISFDVKCHSLKLSEGLIDRYLNKLFDNSDLVNEMAEFEELSIDEFKKQYKKDLEELKNRIKINVYVYKFKFVGFDVEVDGFREAYMYIYENNYDIKINGLLSFLGFEDEKANLRINGKTDNNVDLGDYEKILKNKKFDFNFVFGNSEVEFKDNVITYINNKGDKFVNVKIQISDGKDLGLSKDNLITSSKLINKEHSDFESNLIKNELEVYLFGSLLIYG